jgi:ferritin-like metal-binding protein YciE
MEKMSAASTAALPRGPASRQQKAGPMKPSQQKLVQYLGEAHATEQALVRVLQEQLAVTPSGKYQDALQRHLRETRSHGDRVRTRLDELGATETPFDVAGVFAQSLIAQAVAFAKTPLDLLRGDSGEEKVLKNAKDAAATEALEIATYTAIERLARDLGDEQTARLAASIIQEEQRMLDTILGEIPQLTGKVLAQVRGNPSYDVAKTGAGEAAQNVAETVKDTAASAADKTKSAARGARKVPGVAKAEGTVKGAVASADDLPIAGYDDLNVEEITSRLPQLSQIDLAKVAAYEGRRQNRSTITNRIETLVGKEPWPGYDEQTVADIRKGLTGVPASRVHDVTTYERRHKDRAGVLQAAEAQTAAA